MLYSNKTPSILHKNVNLLISLILKESLPFPTPPCISLSLLEVYFHSRRNAFISEFHSNPGADVHFTTPPRISQLLLGVIFTTGETSLMINKSVNIFFKLLSWSGLSFHYLPRRVLTTLAWSDFIPGETPSTCCENVNVFISFLSLCKSYRFLSLPRRVSDSSVYYPAVYLTALSCSSFPSRRNSFDMLWTRECTVFTLILKKDSPFPYPAPFPTACTTFTWNSVPYWSNAFDVFLSKTWKQIFYSNPEARFWLLPVQLLLGTFFFFCRSASDTLKKRVNIHVSLWTCNYLDTTLPSPRAIACAALARKNRWSWRNASHVS